MPRFYFLLALLPFALLSCNSVAQPDFYNGKHFSHRDTLLGNYSYARTCYDVTHYNLSVRIHPDTHTIEGQNVVSFRAVSIFDKLQLDLDENLAIDSIIYRRQPTALGIPAAFKRDEVAIFITMPEVQKPNSTAQLTVYYKGKPRIAKKAPWDGGMVWATTDDGKPWVGVACEGDGASLWYPCKDGINDEPDSARITLEVPTGLTGVSNGRLVDTRALPDTFTRFTWQVTYPINNYDITLNVANYAHFTDTYTSPEGGTPLALDYYVLPRNLAKAQKQFAQVQPMLAIYEKYFGKYPFWRDGYKLVETPYLGMEHQSCIAYGNQYKRGYLGGLVPSEFNFDFIIIHESGHEYFGNAVTARDHAELWLHESFTTYMEALYVEERYGKEAAIRYLESQKKLIVGEEPIIGPLGVRYGKCTGSDMYYKGTWMLHTLRNCVNDDEKWFRTLRNFYDASKYRTVSSRDFYNQLSRTCGRDYSTILDLYLTYRRIPTLHYSLKQRGRKLIVRYQWETNITGFTMPIAFGNPKNYTRVEAKTQYAQEVEINDLRLADFRVATELFLVNTIEDAQPLTLPKPQKPQPKPKK